MRKSKFAAWAIASLAVQLLVVGLSAQVVPLNDFERFGNNSVHLSFGLGDWRVALAPAAAGSVFERWGVEFQATAGTSLELVNPPPLPSPGPIPPGYPYLTLQNSSSTGEDGPLTVNFRRPVRRVLFVLRKNLGGAVLTAFGPRGERLGAVDVPGNTPQAGLESESPEGIAKIVIEYLTSVQEGVSDLVFDYVSPGSFRTYLPVAGFGRSGQLRFQTEVAITNISNTTGTATLQFFRDDGTPLDLGDEAGNERTVRLAAFQSGFFTLGSSEGNDGELTSGYAKIESDVPLEASGAYLTRDAASGELQEAGAGAASEQFQVTGLIEIRREEDLNTGVALLNPLADAFVSFELEAISGEERLSTLSALLPGERQAVFVDDLFPELRGRNFRGTLVVTADGPIAGIVLRTRNGVATASLPVGGLRQQTLR